MAARRTRRNGEGSIFPYRNGFAAYLLVVKPDGRRGRKWLYGKTREEVHDKWIKLHAAAKAGPVPTKVPTLAEYVAYWLKEIVKPNLAPGSYVTYEVLARRHIVPGLGRKRLDKLAVQDVQTWLNTVRRTCQCCAQGKDAARSENKRRCCAVGECCESLATPATVTHLRRVLRTILSQAVTDGLIARNVAGFVKLPSARRRRGASWSSEEARRFLESARSDNDPLYAAYVLVLVLGLRKGEVLGLAWEDVDQDAAELAVGWQLQRLGGQLVRRETKTDLSEATLPMPGICGAALKRLREDTKDRPIVVGPDWAGNSPIFTTRLGTPIEPRNFNRWWDQRCEAAGVKRITVHGARRTCGSLLVDLDVHPRVAMQILRHAQFSITMEIYSRVSSSATRDALKRLGEVLGDA
jgi:integrase